MIEFDIRPSTKPWKPNPGGQAKFCADWTNRFIALEGGWGGGKTEGGAFKLLRLHMYNSSDAYGNPTGVMSGAVAPTITGAKDYMVPKLLKACDKAGLDARIQLAGAQRDMAIMFQGGHSLMFAPILIRSADRPDRLTGVEWGAGWGDEPARWKTDRHNPTNNAYIQFVGRVRDPKARFVQIMFTYTNEGDATYVYEEFHAGKEDHAIYRAPTSENPLMGEFLAAQRKYLTAELAEQYLEGRAVSFRGGLVYTEFATAEHVVDDINIDPALPLHLSLDFNINPGMHALIGQYHEAEDMFTVGHEIFEPHLDVRGVVTLLRQWVKDQGGWKWPELHVFGDATGRSRWAGTGETSYQILRQGLTTMKIPFKFRVPRQNPPVVDRINAFKIALCDIEDEVHWVCDPQCERLIEDMRKLRRADDGGINKSDEMLSHASDAEGYRIHFLRPARTRKRRTMGRVSV